MLCRIFRFFAIVTIVFTPILVRADDIPAIAITDKTNPKIAELYQKLQDKNAEIAGIESERRGALEENATAMYEKEQSLENKALTATTTATTGLGAMEAASAYAEQLVDADAAEEMTAYITTMRCEYGNGKQVNLGNEETLPGGNELSKYYAEYKQLAEKLKATKKALNLRPGIESEILYDRAESGIYQYQNAEQQSGAYTSLSRALMNPEGEDATKIAAQKQENSEKLKAGLIAAGAGIVAGVIGNYEINKDAPKESSTEINREYDDKVSKVNKEKTDIEAELTNVIDENRQRVQEYNQMVERLRNSRNALEQAPADCRELFSDYIASVSDLELIENEMDVVPDVAIPEMDSDLLAQCVQCKNKGADFNSVTKECKCPADKPVEKGGQCVEKPTEVIPVVEEQPRVEIPVSESQEIEKETPKADYCPKTGNALKSINDTHKVGDNCTSDIISQGTITKRQNGTCTCNATGCWTPYTPKGGKCVKVEGTSTDAGGSDKTGDAYIDENGFCKPYKIKEWFFNKESSADISKKFQKLCDEAAKAHNCKRKDLNTSRLIEKDDSGAVQYEWTCNADSEDYLATQERINQRHANLSYENVCKKLKPGTTNQEGQIKRGCFGIFENIDIPDYKTQLELAKARIGTSSACSEKREVRRSTASNNPVGYYTNCNTTNDKERYTFIFTGVGNDNTTPENLMRAACATYGVKFGAQGGELGRKQPYCSYAYKSIDNDPTCNKINALAQKFGYTARIVRGTGCVLDTTGTVGGDQLAKSGMRSDEKITTLRTAFGIDNNMFANISTNMDEWLYDQMRINIANEMKRAGHSDPLVKFECFPAKSFALDKGVEFKLFGNTSGRNVLTCQANGHDIDFVFAQLGRSTKRRANASQEGLTCIFGSNGKYDGRQCWGVTEDDCKKLDAAIKENAKTCPQCGAKWDGGIGGCTLTKSTKVEKTNKGLEIAGNIALIAGGAVLTVMSGGMAMPMLVTELALMGVEITGATVAAVEEKHMRNVANEFLAKTQYCHDAECAQQLLNDTEVHRILNLESNLDEKQSKVIDDKLAELLRVIPADAPLYVALVNETENKQNCNFWRNATAQCEWAQFWHAWANVAQFASLGVSLGRSAVRFINARKAVIEVAEQTTRKMTRAQAKRIGEIDKEINKIEGITPGRRTAKQAEDLKKLRQERNTILNKVGTKDADEVARLQQAALNEQAIKDAQKEYQAALKKRNEMADYMAKHNGNPPQGKTRFDVKDINDEVAKAEKKLKDLGQDVTPAEPLQIGKKPTVASAETKPADNTAKPKDTKPAESSASPKEPGIEPATPQSRVYEKLGDKIKADIADIKSGKYKELYIPKGQLTDEEWKILREDLAKDGLGITEDPSYFIIKKTNNVDDVVKTSSKADDVVRDSRATANSINVLKGKASPNFDRDLAYLNNDDIRRFYLKKNKLSDEEWKILREDLNKKGFDIVDAEDDATSFWVVKKAETTTPKTTQKTSASPASRSTNSIDALKVRASSNFDNYLQSCVSGGACNGLPVDRLTKEEWQQLNQYAKSRGAELFETKMFNKKTGTYDNVMRFRRLNSTNDVVASTANKLTPAQEEAEWRVLYEKYAPGNQTFDNFKKSFGNNLDEAEEYAKNWGATESLDFGKAEKTADKLWTDFNNKYGTKGDKYPYSKYADIRAQGISADEYLDIKQKGMSTDEYWASKLGWSKEQIEDANKVYVAQQDVKITRNAKTPAGKGDVYSTFDSDIAALRKELQSNLSSSVYDKIDPFFHKGTLTLDEYNNLVEYVSHKTYDSQMLVNAFNKEPGLKDIASEAYDNFLAIKSENIRKIDEAAGLHGGVNRATRELIPKNEFVQNFVSGRVTLYEDIITQNPNIYNRAKRWELLTTTEKEKLCKEIFEIADNKLGIQHVEFGVKDLVKEFGAKTTTEGYQIDGKVYLSSRHLPNMSFQDAMSIVAHEQAHKVDKLSPNKGILGSQLADLGSKEGYIQGFTGYAQGDYRKELTEQSAWMIMDAMKKAISKLGL